MIKKYSKHITLIAAFLSLLLFITACSADSAKQDKSAAAENKETRDTLLAVTSFYPIYILSLNVAEGTDTIQITNMASPQTGCLHDYQLSTEDMKKLDSAHLFLINGMGMESFLDKAIAQYPALKITDTSKGAILVEAHEGHEEHEGHDGEEYNSHIWLSLKNAAIQSENIKKAFSELDPENAAVYEENTEAFQASLSALEKEAEDIDFNGQKAAVFHEGFDYFADTYHMDIEIAIYADENITPSPKEIAEAVEEIKEEKIRLLFAADDSGRAIAETISRETGAKIYILDPLTQGEMNKDAYITGMKQNIEILREALKYANS